MIKKKFVLKENYLFSKAYRKGISAVNRYTAVYVLKNFRTQKDGSPMPTRIGLTVNRKLGKAVRRSRAKRIMRAAYSSISPCVKDGLFVVIAARGALFGKGVKSSDIAPALKASLLEASALCDTDSTK